MAANIIFSPANAVVKGSSPTGVDYFIPELWSDEILAAHKVNLVMQPLVKVMPFSGQKGDTVYVPLPVRGSASVKAAAHSVTLITASDTRFTLTVDQHYEYSRLIEDIVSVQANDRQTIHSVSSTRMTQGTPLLSKKTRHFTRKARSLLPPTQPRVPLVLPIPRLLSVVMVPQYGLRLAPVTVLP